jgi:hypothetical protein
LAHYSLGFATPVRRFEHGRLLFFGDDLGSGTVKAEMLKHGLPNEIPLMGSYMDVPPLY